MSPDSSSQSAEKVARAVYTASRALTELEAVTAFVDEYEMLLRGSGMKYLADELARRRRIVAAGGDYQKPRYTGIRRNRWQDKNGDWPVSV